MIQVIVTDRDDNVVDYKDFDYFNYEIRDYLEHWIINENVYKIIIKKQKK